MYVGVNTGGNFRDHTRTSVGAVVGYQLTRNVAAEVTYDYNNTHALNNGQLVMGNLVVGHRMGAFTPYALAGAGMGWNAYGTHGTGTNQGLYNVGGGMRVNLVSNIDLDARYRYVAGFNTADTFHQHLVTGGVNLRF